MTEPTPPGDGPDRSDNPDVSANPEDAQGLGDADDASRLASGQAREPASPDNGGQPDGNGNGNGESSKQTLVARYGYMRSIGEFRHNLSNAPVPGERVVVRTERGVELAEVLTPVQGAEEGCPSGCSVCISPPQLNGFLEQCGPEYPFRRDGRVLRMANHQDVIDQRHLESNTHDEASFCRQQIKELNLDMKLIAVEHLLGGERIVFYFTAEHRVDFRELVRRLASQYHTRIEMRQVGARDEARLVADYERCGQRVCCQQFLKYLHPVSMRMAKMQKATLDPSKISGRCGRLMCCLRYEDDSYRDLKKRLPKKSIWVRTEELIGKVVDVQILTQLVKLQLPDRTFAVIANEEITERNVDPPSQEDIDRMAEVRRSRAARAAKAQIETVVEETSDEQAQPAESGGPDSEGQPDADKPKKKRRRRRRKKKPSGSGEAAQGQASSGAKGGSQDKGAKDGGDKPKKKRRRRRRKKKPSGDGSSGSGNGGSGGGGNG